MSELSERLAKLEDLKLESIHMGLIYENNWPHDEWRVIVHYKDKSYSGKYSAGIGHRKLLKSAKQKPDIANVIYCWLSDASGSDESFDNWCSNFGYDNDSLRALNTYLECQRIRDGLIKLLGYDLFNELSTLEH